MSTETVHFRYQSPENLVRLLCEIVYEKKHTSREIAIYHERFKGESDEFFAEMLVKLFPAGATIGEDEINQCVGWIDNFLEKDEQAKDIRAKYDMSEYSSYVYFNIDKKVYPCDHTSHAMTVKNICVGYFKGFDKSDITPEKVADFIRNHFVVKSRFSTAGSIANDSTYICRSILMNCREE